MAPGHSHDEGQGGGGEPPEAPRILSFILPEIVKNLTLIGQLFL